MKKYIVIAIISLIFSSQAFAATEQDQKVINELQTMQDNLFSAPVTPLTEIDYSIKEEPETRVGRINPRPNVTPLFKKVRIKIQNYYRAKAYEEAQQILEEERKAAEKINSDDYDGELDKDDIDKMTLRHLLNVKDDDSSTKVKKEKKSFFRKKKDKPQEMPVADAQKTAEQAKDGQVEKADGTLELSGTVKKANTTKDVQLDCDVLKYFDDREEVEATGHPVLYFPPQDVTLKADKIVYGTTSDIIKAYGNVEVIKNGDSVFGDFIQINMNDETSLLTNMKAEKMNLIIHAKNVNAKDNEIVLEKGSLSADKSYPLKFKTRIIGSDLHQMMMDEDDVSTLLDKDKSKVTINANEIFVDAKKDHDIIQISDAEINYNNRHLFDLNHLKVYTNKKRDYFEANYPEFGSRSRIGMFLGPGFVFGVPTGGTVKVIPFLNYKDKIGIGGALKYRSATNVTEFMYGSSENVAVLRGRQQFDDKFFMQYGINSYMDDWFMGTRMAKYMAEFIYQDGVRIKNFGGPKHDLTFRHRVGAGYMKDSDVNRFDEKHMESSQTGTTRLKYMAEISQNIYNYTDKENLKQVLFDIVMQGGAAVYGTGDTQFIGRIGPRLHTQYKYWMQDISYYQSAYQDGTPMPRFDSYRYGRSSVNLREALRVNKYLAVAWSTTINLSDDAPNGKLMQENAFMFALGPDDFKVNLGYDFLRQTTYFGVNVALDMKGTHVNYDKLVIKNPEKLGKNNQEEVEPVSFETAQAPTKLVRQYAEVIDIEDPNREQL